MLIKEIEPINKVGVNLLQYDDISIIDEIIELPLRKACKILNKKGIETVMSSANKNNLILTGEKPIEREDVYGMQFFYPSPTYEDAGKGYSWIMINFDSLSDLNKDLLFSIEEQTNNNGEKIGEKLIWFVHPYIIINSSYKTRTSYEYFRPNLANEKILYDVEIDERLSRFEKKHIVLNYNDRYPTNTVLIRMPINEQTSVEEVEKYFVNFAKSFHDQIVSKKNEDENKFSHGGLR